MNPEVNRMTELTAYYKNLKRLKKQAILLYLGLIAALMVLVSLFLGAPFPHQETELFFTYRVNGWFFDKTWIMYLIIALSALLTFIAEGVQSYRNVNAFRAILYQDCDSEKLLRLADEGIRYVPYEFYRSRRKAERVFRRQLCLFERFYAEALMACGQADAAEHYLENDWKSPRNSSVYKILSANAGSILAYQAGDVGQFKQLSAQGGKRLQQSVTCLARLDWLEGRSSEAMERLKAANPRFPYEKVLFAGMLADFLNQSGRKEEAQEYEAYVLKYGGTLGVRQALLKP